MIQLSENGLSLLSRGLECDYGASRFKSQAVAILVVIDVARSTRRPAGCRGYPSISCIISSARTADSTACRDRRQIYGLVQRLGHICIGGRLMNRGEYATERMLARSRMPSLFAGTTRGGYNRAGMAGLRLAGAHATRANPAVI